MYDGREILTCGRDGEPEPMQKLQDLVNRYVNTGRRQVMSAKRYWCAHPVHMFRSAAALTDLKKEQLGCPHIGLKLLKLH